MASNTNESNRYVAGEADPRRKDWATFETKPSVPGYTGGEYEHHRSSERRPHTPGDGSEDVYCSHHRLLAVVACYDLATPIDEVLADLARKDVHHRSGVPWDNRPENLEVRPHGDHATLTQTQRRAWAEDKKRQLEQENSRGAARADCEYCGDTLDRRGCTSPAFDGRRCLECAIDTCDGAPVEVG
jgi:hypothetical protein